MLDSPGLKPNTGKSYSIGLGYLNYSGNSNMQTGLGTLVLVNICRESTFTSDNNIIFRLERVEPLSQ